MFIKALIYGVRRKLGPFDGRHFSDSDLLEQ
jgi:hypothetical protein